MTTVLRSVLYMPGANDRALEKAKTIPCDGLILDRGLRRPRRQARRPGGRVRGRVER